MTRVERRNIRATMMGATNAEKEVTILKAIDLADRRAARRAEKRQAARDAEAARRAAIQITWNQFVNGCQVTGF